MNKHTPGPWRVYSDDEWSALGGNAPATVAWVASLCVASPQPNYEFHGDAESDARLIAAAPDLLAALKELLRCSAIPEAWAEPARAAIAKAEGGVS